MNLKSKLVAVSLFALVGCGGMEGEELVEQAPAQETTEAVAGEEVATAEQALETADIQCGSSRGFPTWPGWGQTTLNFTNLQTSNGSTIRLMFQAGAANPEYHNVRNTKEVVRGFAGFTVTVTHLGWYNSSGIYTSCLNNTSTTGAPTLRVQSW